MSEQVNREVRIVNNITNKREKITTNATTLGELKEEAGDLLGGDIKVIIRETRNSLDVDDAKLPSESFTLFALAKKVKAGRGDKYDQMGYNDLKQECAARDSISPSDYNGKNGTMENMRELLRADDASSNGASEASSEDVAERTKELTGRVNDVLDKHKEAAKQEISDILSEYRDLNIDEDFFGEVEEEISTVRDALNSEYVQDGFPEG